MLQCAIKLLTYRNDKNRVIYIHDCIILDMQKIPLKIHTAMFSLILLHPVYLYIMHIPTCIRNRVQCEFVFTFIRHRCHRIPSVATLKYLKKKITR
jgi:hypothetical protein